MIWSARKQYYLGFGVFLQTKSVYIFLIIEIKQNDQLMISKPCALLTSRAFHVGSIANHC